MVNCAKRGKEIPAWQEVKKGSLRKKGYDREFVPKCRSGSWQIFARSDLA